MNTDRCHKFQICAQIYSANEKLTEIWEAVEVKEPISWQVKWITSNRDCHISLALTYHLSLVTVRKLFRFLIIDRNIRDGRKSCSFLNVIMTLMNINFMEYYFHLFLCAEYIRSVGHFYNICLTLNVMIKVVLHHVLHELKPWLRFHYTK